MRQQHPLTPRFPSFAMPRRIFSGMAASLFLLFLLPAAQAATPTRTSMDVLLEQAGAVAETILIAHVETAAGSPVTTGTVDFVLPNGQALGSAIVGADGTATLMVQKLPAATGTGVDGSDQLPVAAVYHAVTEAGQTEAGEAETSRAETFAGSTSPVKALASPQATTQAPDFGVTLNPATVTATQGSYGTTAITVTSLGGYTGSIQFSCSGLPAQVTCAFNPTTQTLAANGNFVTTLEINTQGASGNQALAGPLRRERGLLLAVVLPGALLLFGVAGRKRRGLQMLGVALLLCGTGLGLSGCSQRYGYLKHPAPVAGGTPLGTFPITVAVDGNEGSAAIEHDFTVSLVVQ